MPEQNELVFFYPPQWICHGENDDRANASLRLGYAMTSSPLSQPRSASESLQPARWSVGNAAADLTLV